MRTWEFGPRGSPLLRTAPLIWTFWGCFSTPPADQSDRGCREGISQVDCECCDSIEDDFDKYTCIARFYRLHLPDEAFASCSSVPVSPECSCSTSKEEYISFRSKLHVSCDEGVHRKVEADLWNCSVMAANSCYCEFSNSLPVVIRSYSSGGVVGWNLPDAYPTFQNCLVRKIGATNLVTEHLNEEGSCTVGAENSGLQE